MSIRVRNLLAVAVIIFPLMGYMYMKGGKDGVARYKRSRNFEMTLLSAYFYGRGDAVVDCCNGNITCGELKR